MKWEKSANTRTVRGVAMENSASSISLENRFELASILKKIALKTLNSSKERKIIKGIMFARSAGAGSNILMQTTRKRNLFVLTSAMKKEISSSFAESAIRRKINENS